MNNKAAKGTWAAAFTVGSVWFGTHVGGGFASGNQVVSYFAQYGMWAAVHSALSAVSGIHDQRGHEAHRKNIQCPY